MSESHLEILRQMSVFGGLSSDALALILEQSKLRQTTAGQYFFRENDEANSLYVIQQGNVIVERDWQGSPVMVTKLVRASALASCRCWIFSLARPP